MGEVSCEPFETTNQTTRVARNKRKISEVSTIDLTDARLSTHEEICSLRYAGIEEKMTQIDKRFDKVEADIKEIKTDSAKGFKDIKELIERKQGNNSQAIITAAGTIIVALIGFLGYLLTHIK